MFTWVFKKLFAWEASHGKNKYFNSKQRSWWFLVVMTVKWTSSKAEVRLIREDINPTRPFYETGCPQVHYPHNYAFIGLSQFLYCDDWIFMCVLVCNLAVDYITPPWFSNYPSDRPGSGNDLWEFGSVFWLHWASVNQFDFRCLSELACIYT